MVDLNLYHSFFSSKLKFESKTVFDNKISLALSGAFNCHTMERYTFKWHRRTYVLNDITNI